MGPVAQMVKVLQKDNPSPVILIPTELLLLILGATNDQYLKAQFEPGQQQNKQRLVRFENQKYRLYSGSQEASKLVSKRQRLYSILQITLSRFLSGIKDQPQMAFNLGVHPSLLKVTNDSQDQYESNDLIRIVILECIEITKLLLDDEDFQKQGIDPIKLADVGMIDVSWL